MFQIDIAVALLTHCNVWYRITLRNSLVVLNKRMTLLTRSYICSTDIYSSVTETRYGIVRASVERTHSYPYAKHCSRDTYEWCKTSYSMTNNSLGVHLFFGTVLILGALKSLLRHLRQSPALERFLAGRWAFDCWCAIKILQLASLKLLLLAWINFSCAEKLLQSIWSQYPWETLHTSRILLKRSGIRIV